MALVLVNPLARGGRVRRLLPAMSAALDTLTPFPRLLVPTSVDDALDGLMREAEGARVVVVGGDGTLNRWLPALLARRLSVGLVPLGSGNDLARALGLNLQHWQTALADALQGRSRPMDSGLAVWTDLQGEVHRTPFASSLTCGFDAAVGRRALQGPAWLYGLPRYLWATLAEWRQLDGSGPNGHAGFAGRPDAVHLGAQHPDFRLRPASGRRDRRAASPGGHHQCGPPAPLAGPSRKSGC